MSTYPLCLHFLFCLQLREGRITFYVEHPVLIEPPAEAPPPPPQPLKLTKRVRVECELTA